MCLYINFITNRSFLAEAYSDRVKLIKATFFFLLDLFLPHKFVWTIVLLISRVVLSPLICIFVVSVFILYISVTFSSRFFIQIYHNGITCMILFFFQISFLKISMEVPRNIHYIVLLIVVSIILTPYRYK